MLQMQPRHFTGAQPVDREEHENRPISYVRRILCIQRSKQPLDIAPIRTGRQTLQGINPWPLNAIGEMGSDPLPLGAVAKERLKSVGDVVHRDATPALCAAVSQVGIHITDLHVCEVSFESAVPAQKMLDVVVRLLDGGFGQPALVAGPSAILPKPLVKRD